MPVPPRRPRLRPANPWGDDLSPEVPARERPLGRGLRPQSAPAGGDVAVCPHCWGLNVSGQRLCGRCGADMTLLLQESGGLRRTPAVQSPVPVRVAGRLGIGARAVLLVMTAALALTWLVVPLLGGGLRMHRQTRGRGDTATRGVGRSQIPAHSLTPASATPAAPHPEETRVPASPRRRVPVSAGRRPALGTVPSTGRV